ncbi:thermostable hemolysin [Streptomyces cylindrosporus]|uniref:Thermostable hemolysin n=1 Tax=Streptomyces cylindrosporus TaxID=2927583 RepID=A0ABS9YCW3_9ACTN|nr:thermostable hemolysin [Streptomyces cylindrosporus]MCI3275060.1 thermostable hemolysin [Streptomyces cylindrosporus]
MPITIGRRGSALWQACADLARDRYERDYQARIAPSPDLFIALCASGMGGGADVTPSACAGLTYGGKRRLLIENYLGDTAADVIGRRTGVSCEPTSIVEVGPLAAANEGSGLELLRMLPALCWCNGAEFALCTITRPLSVMLARIGVDFVPLADAREDLLPEEQRGHWGTYYDTAPQAGYVDLRRFGAEISQRAEMGYHLAVTWGQGATAPAGAR